ncbi:hypothetical protein HT031_004377 [Scenedesmus sp. PABB004]|nr:hypothetical protein HT031_004377 [Scenedesmus sp. PABB004]
MCAPSVLREVGLDVDRTLGSGGGAADAMLGRARAPVASRVSWACPWRCASRALRPVAGGRACHHQQRPSHLGCRLACSSAGVTQQTAAAAAEAAGGAAAGPDCGAASEGGAAREQLQLKVQVLTSIAEVGEAEWDALVGAQAEVNPTLKWRFLHILEDSGSAAPNEGWGAQHVTVRDARSGALLGAAPAYLKAHSYGEFVFDSSWANYASMLGQRYYPKLQVAVPFTPVTGNRLLVAPGPLAALVTKALAQSLVAITQEMGLSSLHVTFPTGAEAAALGALGFQQRRGIQYHWDNRGYVTFEDFLADLKQSRRKSIRQERKSVAKQGLTVRRLRGGEVPAATWDAFYDFYEDTVDRKWGTAYMKRTVFHRLGSEMGDDVLLVVAEEGGEVVAAALNLVGSACIYGRNWGLRPGRQYRHLHFELCYYQAIEEAIARGLPRVEAGAQGEHKLQARRARPPAPAPRPRASLPPSLSITPPPHTHTQRGYLPSFTHSAHFLADPTLRGAVAKFLQREDAELAYAWQALTLEGSPYKVDTTVAHLAAKISSMSSLSSGGSLSSAEDEGPPARGGDRRLGIVLRAVRDEPGALEACASSCSALAHALSSRQGLLRLWAAAQARRAGRGRCRAGLGAYRLAGWARLRRLRHTPSGGAACLGLMLDAAALDGGLAPGGAAAAKAWAQGAGDALAAGAAVAAAALPHAAHCLLPFAAAGGQAALVAALVPIMPAAPLGGCHHYVRSSAFFAAAAAGHADVLRCLLAGGALSWAAQQPGASATSMALDLAAQGGHVAALEVLRAHATPGPTFLCHAAHSGSAATMTWALSFFFSQFNAVQQFGPEHAAQLQDALRVACTGGHASVTAQLLRYLAALRVHDAAVLALSFTAATANTDALRAVLESPILPQQLARAGPRLLAQTVQVVGACLRLAIRSHAGDALELLLSALGPGQGCALSAARPLLGPQMCSVFDQAGAAGNVDALHKLLTRLPELWEGLTPSALEAALAEGHDGAAATIRSLLLLRGPDGGCAPEALSAAHSPALAAAARLGALKAAASRGDAATLHALLGEAQPLPDARQQLALLRTAAGAGHAGATLLLLQLFGGGAGDAPGAQAGLCLRAACRGAVLAGRLELLQALAAPGAPAAGHLAAADGLAEYLRAALLCGQTEAAGWLVAVAGRQGQLGLVASTLNSLLTAPRWELWNTSQGAQESVAALLAALADEGLPAHADGGGGSFDGAALLTPELVGLLLHAAAGSPDMLLSVVELAECWGVREGGEGPPPEQLEQPTAPAPREQAAAAAAAAALARRPRDRCSVGGATSSGSSSYTTVRSSSSSLGSDDAGAAGGALRCARGAAPCRGGSDQWPLGSWPDGHADGSWAACGRDAGRLARPPLWLQPADSGSLGSPSSSSGASSSGGGGTAASPSGLRRELLGPAPSPSGLRRTAGGELCAPLQPGPPLAAGPEPLTLASAGSGASSSLQQLTGRVEVLSVGSTPPLRRVTAHPCMQGAAAQQQQQRQPPPPQQQEEQHRLRRSSQPAPGRPSAPRQPLLSAMSLPAPTVSRSAPEHPYMRQARQARTDSGAAQ